MTGERAEDAAKEIMSWLAPLKLPFTFQQGVAELIQRAIDDAIEDRMQDADPSGG